MTVYNHAWMANNTLSSSAPRTHAYSKKKKKKKKNQHQDQIKLNDEAERNIRREAYDESTTEYGRVQQTRTTGGEGVAMVVVREGRRPDAA